MQKRILVAYATGTGATVGVAEKIGETLGGRGYSVDVKPVTDNPDPAAYDAVVIGSAVNGARWRPEAVAYVENHQSVLKQKPVAMFCVHILNRGEDAGARKNRLGYLDAVRKLVTPVSEGFFLGKGMDASNTAPVLMWVMKLTKFVPEGDCRDWGKISAWASGLSL